jgi:predicted dehydrogenase
MTSKSLSLAVVGLGGWGKNVAASFAAAQRCRLACICDVNPAALRHHQSLHPSARATNTYDAVLSDKSVQAVAIATPAAAHYEMARAALLAGKHVYVEKPLTLSARHAEELADLADEQGRKLMVGHVFEYHPAVEYMQEQIAAGALGNVYYAYCQRLNLGLVRQHENAFWSLAPHDVSIILRLFGADPVRVSAEGASFLQKGVEDVVFATLHFADGRMAQIHVSWLDPHKERKVVVVGSRKMVVFDDMEPNEKVRVFDKGAKLHFDAASHVPSIGVRHGDIHIPHLSLKAPLDIETQHFVDCVLDDRPARSDGRQGMRVVRILEEVERQLQTARRDADLEHSQNRQRAA